MQIQEQIEKKMLRIWKQGAVPPDYTKFAKYFSELLEKRIDSEIDSYMFKRLFTPMMEVVTVSIFSAIKKQIHKKELKQKKEPIPNLNGEDKNFQKVMEEFIPDYDSLQKLVLFFLVYTPASEISALYDQGYEVTRMDLLDAINQDSAALKMQFADFMRVCFSKSVKDGAIDEDSLDLIVPRALRVFEQAILSSIEDADLPKGTAFDLDFTDQGRSLHLLQACSDVIPIETLNIVEKLFEVIPIPEVNSEVFSKTTVGYGIMSPDKLIEWLFPCSLLEHLNSTDLPEVLELPTPREAHILLQPAIFRYFSNETLNTLDDVINVLIKLTKNEFRDILNALDHSETAFYRMIHGVYALALVIEKESLPNKEQGNKLNLLKRRCTDISPSIRTIKRARLTLRKRKTPSPKKPAQMPKIST